MADTAGVGAFMAHLVAEGYVSTAACHSAMARDLGIAPWGVISDRQTPLFGKITETHLPEPCRCYFSLRQVLDLEKEYRPVR